MKEKELRLALVFYGGVSLAIYQHGVNVEILNLIRASRAYHAPPSFAKKQDDGHIYTSASNEAISTETVYFDLLKLIGKSLDLRVVVDVISGSSAGGINGIVLARAIAHDLTIAPLTEMWFAKADLLQLISPDARAGRWSKWYLAPFLRPIFARLEHLGLLPRNDDSGIRERLSTFVRSRWFKPPFDGPHFSGLLLDGLAAMEEVSVPSATLLPAEVTLDLMITVTDYHGADKLIFMHDPAVIREREHRHILQFSAVSSPHGLAKSDFQFSNVPSLAFAGRASASYPGAFPPAQIKEMDDIVAARKLSWSGREQFLVRNFSHYRQIGLDPDQLVLLDGSILNNKPLLAAISAVRKHTAYREVDRRLVYIDPHPDRQNGADSRDIPGFFATLRGALSDLPRHNPIYEELEETNRLNDQIRRLKSIIRISHPQVESLIEQATNGGLSGDITLEQVRHWRLTSTNLLSSSTLVYNAWMRGLVLEGVDLITDLVASLCGYVRQSQQAHWVRRVIEAWCDAEGMFPERYHIPDTVNADAELPSFARFIVDFGTKYKSRRISYVLQNINKLNEIAPTDRISLLNQDSVNDLKLQINDCLRKLQVLEDPSFLQRLPAERVRQLFRIPEAGPRPSAVLHASRNQAELSEVIAQLGRVCGFVGTNEELDEILASPLVAAMPPQMRRIILTGYLGWPYWDVVVLPAMNALGLESNAFEEVWVDRISPQDARSVCADEGCGELQGETVVGFGGFLSRRARENDYLWGRIHGIDRLIDIVASTFNPVQLDSMPDFAAFKKRAFTAMLQQEADRLPNIPDVVAVVRTAIDKL